MGYLRLKQNTSQIISRKKVSCKAKPITDVLNSNSWSGKRCFILCGGPSLENFDFGKIQNEYTISINKSFLKFNSTICYGMDRRFYDSVTHANRADQESFAIHNAWLMYKGIKVFPKNSDKAKFDPNVYVVNAIKNSCISLNLNSGIYTGNNSGFGGMMLAIALGCREIYMLGLDMKVDFKKSRTHHHAGYKHQKIEELQKVLMKFKKDFEIFSHGIKKLGIKVINLNPDSNLECFPKKDIREVL